MVASVIYLKEGEGRNFLIIDAAMNDLIRPALYDAHHEIIPVNKPISNTHFMPFDIVGPVCETGDTFANQRQMPNVQPGEMLAFKSAGAYGSVMASEYNTRPMISEVLVSGNKFSIIVHGLAFKILLIEILSQIGYKNINFELLYIDGILLSGC